MTTPDAEAGRSLHALLGRGGRTALAWDLLEAASGVVLAAFVFMHVLAVSVGAFHFDTFDAEAALLERTYVAPAGIAFIVFVLLAHMALAGRRIPLRLGEMRIAWRQARLMGLRAGLGTWAWLFQAVSGVAVGLLAAAHVWTVVAHGTIDAATAVARVSQPATLALYLLLLALALAHAAVGLYRIAVKWTPMPRARVRLVLNLAVLLVLAAGLAGLAAFRAAAPAASASNPAAQVAQR